MLRRIKRALAPDKSKWFDWNDVKILAGAGLALASGWVMLVVVCGLF